MATYYGTVADDVLSGAANDVIFGGEGADAITDGPSGGATLYGGEGDDHLVSAVGSSFLDGGEGYDFLNATYNAFGTLIAGAGNDFVWVETKYWTSATMLIDGGIDFDTLVFDAFGSDANSVPLDLSRVVNFERIVITGYLPVRLFDSLAAPDTTLTIEAYRDATCLWVDGSAETDAHLSIIGLNQGDMLIGGQLSDILIGGTGSDSLYGGEGNDRLSLASGIVDGGTGTDVLEAGDNTPQDIAFTGIEVLVTNGATLSGNAEQFTSVGSIVSQADSTDPVALQLVNGGTVNVSTQLGGIAASVTASDYGNTITTGTGADTLIGGTGADTLSGGANGDTMAGRSGDDIYFVNNALDLVIEADGDGMDRVSSSASYTLMDFVENLVLTSSAVSGTGNALGNEITGNTVNNTLFGMDGNDQLSGGAGADLLYGGAGNDVYFVNIASDLVIEADGDGMDRVSSSASYTLMDFVENLVLISSAVSGTGNALGNEITGNTVNNTLFGMDGNDQLSGGAGADLLYGGAGNDVYFVSEAGDVVNERSAITGVDDSGTDTVQTYVDSYVLGDFVERLTLLGATRSGTGNDRANQLTGNNYDNKLYGLAGDDVLNASSGNDLLVGGAGDDTLTGGTGRDQFVFGAAPVLVNGADRITDFISGSDRLVFDDLVFSLTSTGTVGALAPGQFHLGAAAASADDFLMYDQGTGRLFFDADGSAAGAQVQIALLNAGQTLTATDIFLV